MRDRVVTGMVGQGGPAGTQPAQVAANSPLALTPLLDPSLSDLVHGQPQILQGLVERFGSPLNIVWPDLLKKNMAAMRRVQQRHGLRLDVYYACKANKSHALVRAAVETGAGVEVSSEYEMADAVRLGAAPALLCATGPAKTDRFLRRLIAAGCLISIDSAEEFSDVRTLVGEVRFERPARVLLRYRPASEAASRFGMADDDLRHCLSALTETGDSVILEGFHIHLSGYQHQSRLRAVRQLARHIEEARRMGLTPHTLNIGGGMPVRYVGNASPDALTQAGNPHQYRNGKAPADVYPYDGRVDAEGWLDLLLEAPYDGGVSVAQYLDTHDLTLAIEPGRSLADQAAMSIFRITRVKALPDRTRVLFVEGSSFSACETWFASEFMVDPILVPQRARVGAPARAWIAGHSCLDEDVITNRLVPFQVLPCADDLLVYPNTGGYQMDLLENEFHRHPMPRRIAARRVPGGDIDVWPDDGRGSSG
ncbi:hypothetical protein [Micromonospora sp. HUAS LYJ1]|uniref:hypothetical protein n=1 Tax=Micromonospora sp. HUAS LYJ1 TaxID=3061626 RepID=UPI002671E9D4|nr:hypothetical protein [Micromonospora sp. HUAS LYJ1]WKU05552.1 hypothetical protein Q2K16_00320 [Micromonospora sp. HUAS LYJ1]